MKIKQIRKSSNEDVYDITTEKNHNFYAHIKLPKNRSNHL